MLISLVLYYIIQNEVCLKLHGLMFFVSAHKQEHHAFVGIVSGSHYEKGNVE